MIYMWDSQILSTRSPKSFKMVITFFSINYITGFLFLFVNLSHRNTSIKNMKQMFDSLSNKNPPSDIQHLHFCDIICSTDNYTIVPNFDTTYFWKLKK